MPPVVGEAGVKILLQYRPCECVSCLCSQALLQQELHRTSQFAIKLSEKFKAKRQERDTTQQQLDAALE